jgi:ribokinase
MRFVVVGAYVADCLVTAPRLPQWGEVYQARSIRTSPGGKALNQAVALARLGAHVCAVGAVGDDGLGRDIVSALTREGIETECLVTRENAATSICICFAGDNGQTSFAWHIGEDVAVTPDIVRGAEPALRQADAVLITFEAPVSAIRKAITLTSRCDARVFVNPAPALADPAAVAALPWRDVDVLVPNEAEARAILEGLGASRQPLEIADLAGALASELSVPLVIVTLGESGCAVHSHGVTRRYPAQQTAPADTTGASDAFTAALAASLVQGKPEVAAIKAATAAAAFTVGRQGGYESMPSPAMMRGQPW